MPLLKHSISKGICVKFTIPRISMQVVCFISFIFSRFFYKDTDHAMPVDVPSHSKLSRQSSRKNAVSQWIFVKYQNYILLKTVKPYNLANTA